MKSKIVLVVIACCMLCGCGDVYVKASWDGGTTEVSGTVNQVRAGSVVDSQQGSIPVTVVTLLHSRGSEDLTICGNHANEFPISAYVSVKYTAGPQCSTLVSLTVQR